MRANGIEILIKYAFYDASQNKSALNRVIARLKHIPDKLTFAYFAAVLSVQVDKLCKARGFGKKELCFTHVPRSKTGIAKDGFDQAKMLAMALSKRTKLPHETFLLRKKGGKPQKTLSFDERAQNVCGAFRLKRGADLCGKTVILVDDVVTTGATASECAKLLYDGGAAEVICLCIAKAEKIKE
jgi:ComF family protein